MIFKKARENVGAWKYEWNFRKEEYNFRKYEYKFRNGILWPKLLGPTVRTVVLYSEGENFWDH